MNAVLPWLAPAGVLVCVTLLVWITQGLVRDSVARYRAVFTESARVRMTEFFFFIDVNQLWWAHVALVGALACAGGLLAHSWAGACMGAGAGALLPRYVAARLRRQRVRRFDVQLPDALLALGGALRAGVSLQAGLRPVVAEAEAPLAQEFALMLREQRFGIGMEQSLAHLHARMPTEAASLAVAALRIAADTGGNLAETLERIALTVRARLHMEGRIRALTAQGRLQARIVAALPALLVGALSYLEPEAMRQLWSTAAGWSVLGVVVSLDALGLWLIHRIVRIDV